MSINRSGENFIRYSDGQSDEKLGDKFDDDDAYDSGYDDDNDDDDEDDDDDGSVVQIIAMAGSGTGLYPIDHQTFASGHHMHHNGHHRIHRDRLTDTLPGASKLYSALSMPDVLMDTYTEENVSTHNITSRELDLGAPHFSRSSNGGQNVINYDVNEDSNGNTAIKLLTTLTPPASTSTISLSSAVSIPGSVYQKSLHNSVDSSFFVNTNWSTNQTDTWDTTALPEPEVYNVPRLSAEIQVALYSIIFSTALVGNLLIIVTLIQNKRMRTVTNVFLLNLAVSDLLLALVCMPFTLVPVLLMDFIFGAFMCVFIRYLQVKYHDGITHTTCDKDVKFLGIVRGSRTEAEETEECGRQITTNRM
ncbi:cholecystokinin receptor type A [Elysia marginata]|uniref:Cholecystokinin receptor type A n=1 Tax=Elysia marginata TaxID=1093978 RepID=A0AAV4FIS2_9GAST|nr:cholecystokinin receptor type A [Elysia marginata]